MTRQSSARDSQDGIAGRWTGFLGPLNIAAYITWLAVVLDVIRRAPWDVGPARQWAAVAALALMLALFLWRIARDRARTALALRANVLLQAALIVLAQWLLGAGQPLVLLIIVAAQAVWSWSLRAATLVLALFNGVVLWHWASVTGTFWPVALQLLPVVAFQAFAGLTAHFASMAELSRAGLARMNAELMATQQLLQESARTDERLRLSRELHDVSGHKLTALKLHLARLERDPTRADRAELGICSQLTDELLSDLRGVVGALRQHDGLEFSAALRALARPLGHARIEVDVPADLRVDSVARADALLRAAQEGITNALRHGGARVVRIACRRSEGGILLEVSNDGARPGFDRLGNGLTGMQERLLTVGGHMQLDPGSEQDPVTLRVWLPEASA